MTKADKLLQRKRNNPRDWSIDDLKTLAIRHGIEWRQPGTSHVTFSKSGIAPLTVLGSQADQTDLCQPVRGNDRRYEVTP